MRILHMNGFFDSGRVTVGNKSVLFSARVVRDRFLMYVPSSFLEDPNLVSNNYSYLFSKDKSPLSIAIKFSPAATAAEKEKLVTLYFNQAAETLNSVTVEHGDVLYRETVTRSEFLSVYSLRFSAAVPGGLLFGCFNCSADYKDDWRPVVLQMLQNIHPIAAEAASQPG